VEWIKMSPEAAIVKERRSGSPVVRVEVVGLGVADASGVAPPDEQLSSTAEAKAQAHVLFIGTPYLSGSSR
jgi:hypothetical protein